MAMPRSAGETCEMEATRASEWRPITKVTLAMIFVSCCSPVGGSIRGDASAGPNPGGSFYGAPNIDIGALTRRDRRVVEWTCSKSSSSGSHVGDNWPRMGRDGDLLMTPELAAIA